MLNSWNSSLRIIDAIYLNVCGFHIPLPFRSTFSGQYVLNCGILLDKQRNAIMKEETNVTNDLGEIYVIGMLWSGTQNAKTRLSRPVWEGIRREVVDVGPE